MIEYLAVTSASTAAAHRRETEVGLVSSRWKSFPPVNLNPPQSALGQEAKLVSSELFQTISTDPGPHLLRINIYVLANSILDSVLNKTCLGIDPPCRTSASPLME